MEVTKNITAPDCCLVECHFCNVPTKTFPPDPTRCEKEYVISIESIEDTYDFVCQSDEDLFVVAGHATVKWDTSLHGDGSQTAELTYSAYFDFTLDCEPQAH